MSDMSITPEQIKAGRERRRITQAELAKELGVSLRTITSWEAGDSVPRNRTAALIEALNLDEPQQGYQWGEQSVRDRIGALAKQRREELGLSRDAMAERAKIAGKQTIMQFEFARVKPRGDTLRAIEKTLEWKLGSIDEAIDSGMRAGDLSMEFFDQYDRTPKERPLASYPTPDLLREVALRIEALQAGMGPATAAVVDHGPANLYGLAANTDPSHLERIAEEGNDKD